MNCFIISKAHPNFLVSIDYRSSEEGAQFVLAERQKRSLHQQFMFLNDHLIASDSGKTIRFSSKGNHSPIEPVVQRDLKRYDKDAEPGSDNMTLYYTDDYRIVNQHGMCLDVEGGRFESGAPLFFFERAPPGSKESESQEFLLCTRLHDE